MALCDPTHYSVPPLVTDMMDERRQFNALYEVISYSVMTPINITPFRLTRTYACVPAKKVHTVATEERSYRRD